MDLSYSAIIKISNLGTLTKQWTLEKYFIEMMCVSKHLKAFLIDS